MSFVEGPVENSERCAELVNKFWQERGFVVNAHVVTRPLYNGRYCYPIVSNLINGWPGTPTEDNLRIWKEWIK